MSIEDVLPSAASFFGSFDQSVALIILLVILFASVVYIVSSFNHLILVFKNKDNSFTQNSHIIIKILTMIFLSFVVYEIAKIIIIK